MKRKILYVGIDPSINSTGLVAILEELDDGTIISSDEKFFIIKPDAHEKTKAGKDKDPLTKREHEASEQHASLTYMLYDKEQVDKAMPSYENERRKTMSFINIVNAVMGIIKLMSEGTDEVVMCIEGVSYGSKTKTTAVFDLAGLNYMIRSMMVELCKDEAFNMYVTPPAMVKKFATGIGNANKDLVIDVFMMYFPDLSDVPKVDDIADAYFMAKLGKSLNNDDE